VGLVAYQQEARTGATLLHVWNGREWVHISADDFTFGSFLAGAPDETIVIGPQDSLPAELVADPTWSRKVRRIPSLEIAEILNSLHPTFRFTPAEWRVLAREFDLKLQDQNAERRRFGRYGAQPVKPPTPLPEPEEPKAEAPTPMPPAQEAEALPPPIPVEPATPKAVEPPAPAKEPVEAPKVEAPQAEAPTVEPPKAEPPVQEAAPAAPASIEKAPALPPPNPADK
jgi:hypothetical protein